MAARTNSKRACIMIVDHDWDYGIRLADWLASQRYQAALVRSLQTAVPVFLDIRPGAVLVGIAQTESAFPLDLQRLFCVIETACTYVPVIIMGNRTSGVFTNIAYSRFPTPSSSPHQARRVDVSRSSAPVRTQRGGGITPCAKHRACFFCQPGSQERYARMHGLS